MTDYCYFCGDHATSREHIPPKCLFPERKDLPDGVDYRKNLITVPSCDIHNSNKSEDDEYLCLVFLHGYFNNSVSQNHFNSKVVRSIIRRPALLFAFYETQTPLIVDGNPTVSVEIDRTRFESSIERIVKGLVFNKYGFRWKEPIEIHTPVLIENNQPNADKINCLVTKLCYKIISKLKYIEKSGDNPGIFWYQLLLEKEKDALFCRMMFYEGFDIFAVSHPLPNNLKE